MTDGTWRVTSGRGGQGVCQRLVVGINGKLSTFEEVEEMFDSQVDRKQLTVKGAVAGFIWLELFREKGDGLPFSIIVLLQDGSSTCQKHPPSGWLGPLVWGA